MCQDSVMPGKRVEDLLRDARARLQRITPEQAHAEQRDHGALIVDTRTFEQRRAQGSIPGALVIDRTVFEWRLDPASAHHVAGVTDHDVRIIVICRQGFSSSLAAASLLDLGLHRATDVIGGFDAWRDAGLPVEAFDSETYNPSPIDTD
jgi:rhodanese-related sulfurtransferase